VDCPLCGCERGQVCADPDASAIEHVMLCRCPHPNYDPERSCICPDCGTAIPPVRKPEPLIYW
jgi:hypothetical protein